MNISTWPEDNYYFNYGANKILKGIKYKNIKSVLIIHLTRVSVAKLIQSSLLTPRAYFGVIIIYDADQRPLADYLAFSFRSVLAALPLSNCILRIQEIPLVIGNTEIKLPRSALTHNEFQALYLYVCGFSAMKHAEMQDINLKTVYAHRRNVVKKLGLRKLSHLFLS